MSSPVYNIVLVACLIAPLSACVLQTPIKPPTAQASLATRPMAPVTVRLGGVFPRVMPKKTLDFGTNVSGFAQFNIVKARLKVSGPNQASQTLAEVAWSPAEGSSSTPASFTASAPVGPNQVFTVEGLNGGGQVVMRLRGAATVTASPNNAVKIDFMHDAAARVIEAMLKAAPDTTLLDVDRTALLYPFLRDLCGFTESNNTYAFNRNAPQDLLVERLATALLSAPTDYPSSPDPVAEWFTQNPVTTDTDSEFVESLKGYYCQGPFPNRVVLYVEGMGPNLPNYIPYPSGHFSDYKLVALVPINGRWAYETLEVPPGSDFGEFELPNYFPPGQFAAALCRATTEYVGAEETPVESLEFVSLHTIQKSEPPYVAPDPGGGCPE